MDTTLMIRIAAGICATVILGILIYRRRSKV